MSPELIEYFPMRVSAFGSVAVPAEQPCLREGVTCLLLQFLGAKTEEFYPPTLALRTDTGDGHPVITLMTEQGIFCQMIGKRKLTAPAGKNEATITALNKGGGASSVKE
jgi:hypothetical protein